MRRIRVIPTLLISNKKLVKTVNFKNPSYVGDPINAVKIFNEKEVDEVAIIDISATKNNKEPNYNLISDIAGEAFMPLSYGGGISKVEYAKKIIQCGVEKLIINNASQKNFEFIKNLKSELGSQSIVISIDIKKNWLGRYKIYSYLRNRSLNFDIIDFVTCLEKSGAGEILLNYVDKEGTFLGYDVKHCAKITNKLDIPVILSGGCSSLNDMYRAIKVGNASAVAAGSYFVYQLPHKAVMINYPEQKKLMNDIYLKL